MKWEKWEWFIIQFWSGFRQRKFSQKSCLVIQKSDFQIHCLSWKYSVGHSRLQQRQNQENSPSSHPQGTRRMSLTHTWKVSPEESSFVFQVETATDTEICSIMLKFAFNVRKKNRNNYKDQSLKYLWNNITKQIMEKVYDSQKRLINLFNNLAFKTAQQKEQNYKKTQWNGQFLWLL